MEDVEKLVKTSLSEIERLLSTKTVVGEPMTFEDNTLIPLVRIAFGFGAGGGAGTSERSKGQGSGGGATGGALIRPVAVIIINKEGVKVEPIRGATASLLEKAGGAVMKAVERRGRKEKEEKEEKEE